MKNTELRKYIEDLIGDVKDRIDPVDWEFSHEEKLIHKDGYVWGLQVILNKLDEVIEEDNDPMDDDWDW
jgi:hypothetical protein